MNPSLNLIFFHFSQMMVNKFKLSFQEDIVNIEPETKKLPLLFIPESVFEHGKDKTAISITLYDESKNHKTYIFNIYYGNNIAYVQTDVLSRNVHEFIFKNISELKIREDAYEFTELDNLGNKNRKRLTLINYKSDIIEINGMNLSLSDIILNNSSEAKIAFNQISVLDLENKIFIIQPIKEQREYDVKFFENNKSKLMKFENKITKLFSKKGEDYEQYIEKIRQKYDIMDNHDSLDLNRNNDYLKKLFNNNTLFEVELFWNYSLCRFFIDIEKDYILRYKKIVKNFISKLKKIKDKIEKGREKKENTKKIEIKDELPLYEIFRTIYTLFTIIYMKAVPIVDNNEIKNLNIRYALTSEKKDNSIIDKTFKFYNKFVDSITEESAIFPYLLYIDGGSGYYDNHDVYTFDLKNLDMLKSHLKQVFPKVIIFCYIQNGEEALTESEFGGIVINDFYLSNNKVKNYNMDKLKDITEEEKDDIAVSLFLYLIHEASGHKKYALSEKDNNSPKKIFNKDNKIIKLEHQNEYIPNDNSTEYILKSYRNEKKGDSGHYLELCYGKYNNKLIIEILRKMKNKGKLLNYPELFTDNGKKLNEYVSLRKQIEENNINIDFKYDITIDDEINLMRNELEKLNNVNQNNQNEEIISTKNEINNNMLLNRGKRKRDDVNLEDDDIENDNNKNKRKKFMKEYSLNFIKSNNYEEKKDNKKDENYNSYIKKNKILTREEMLDNAIKRVGEKYNIHMGPLLKQKLIKIKREIDINNPYYNDINILLRVCNIKY